MKFIQSLSLAFGFALFLSCGSEVKERAEKIDSTMITQDSMIRFVGKIENVIRIPDLPDSLFFAGEKVPLENESVRIKLLQELIIQSNRHSKTLNTFIEKPFWEGVVKQTLKENEVPEDVFYLSIAESDFEVNAVSRVGAVGIWQLMPQTAKEYGLILNGQIDQRRDLVRSTTVASRYIKKAKEKFGSWALALASYNRGMAGIERTLKSQEVMSYYDLYLNEETSRYFFRILACKLLFENPAKYGYFIQKNALAKEIKYKKISLNKGKYNLVKLAQKYHLNYAILKKYNPWIIDSSKFELDIKEKMNVILWLPN
jgi:hypothetical protein